MAQRRGAVAKPHFPFPENSDGSAQIFFDTPRGVFLFNAGGKGAAFTVRLQRSGVLGPHSKPPPIREQLARVLVVVR